MAVVSDHDVMWTGLAAVVSGVTSTALRPERSVAELEPALSGATPLVVLYDVGCLVDADGTDLDRLLRAERVRTLVVVRDLRPDLTEQARRLGADEFVSCHATSIEIRQRIAQVIGTALREVVLTQRERDVLVRIARGLSNQEICDELFVSINSVKTYVRSSYRKIGVTSRSQAVAWCLSHGLRP